MRGKFAYPSNDWSNQGRSSMSMEQKMWQEQSVSIPRGSSDRDDQAKNVVLPDRVGRSQYYPRVPMVCCCPTKNTLGTRMDRLHPASGGPKNQGGCKNPVPPKNEECPPENTEASNSHRLCNPARSTETIPVFPAS